MRKEGYYWVNYEGKWVIGNYIKIPVIEKYFWFLLADEQNYTDYHFIEIDETPITRNNK